MTAFSLYTTMAGLQGLTARMDATAANISNAQTTGYAAVQAATEASTYSGANAPAGADSAVLTPGPDTTEGAITQTGDPFDVAVGGNAWMQVQTPDGTSALTRNGSLQVNNAGILADSAGNPVLGVSGQPISLPTLSKLEIGADGTVSGVPASQPGGAAQNYGQISMVATPSGYLKPLSGTLMLPPAGATLLPDPDATMHQGFLNGSNVDATQSMMQMINDSRSYQLQTDMMKNQSSGTDLNTLVAQG
jgi:flagellar basal-body rod protein FlgF